MDYRERELLEDLRVHEPERLARMRRGRIVGALADRRRRGGSAAVTLAPISFRAPLVLVLEALLEHDFPQLELLVIGALELAAHEVVAQDLVGLASPLELVRQLLLLLERNKLGFRALVLAPRSGVLDDRRRRRAHHAAIGDRVGELLLPLTSSAPVLAALRHQVDVLSSKSLSLTPFFAAAVGHGEVVRYK